MKCSKPYSKSRLAAAWHRLVCVECRQYRKVDDAVDAVVATMRTAPIPATPSGLSTQLQAPRVVSRTAWWPAGLIAVAAILAITFAIHPWSHTAQTKARDMVADHTTEKGSLAPANEEVKSSRENPTTPSISRKNLVKRDAPQRRLNSPGVKTPKTPRTIVPDEDFLNPGRTGVAIAYGGPPLSATKLLPMKDDFVAPPPILVASVGDPESLRELIKQQEANYEQERQVTDAQLYKSVTFSLKHASMEEFCADLASQTGVTITAGRNVADDNLTLFITARPAREVMREVSRVFGFIWERTKKGEQYTYELRQDTPAQIAEEKLRNDDVLKSIETLSKKLKAATNEKPGEEHAAKTVFQNLSLSELNVLRSGRTLRLTTDGDTPTDGPLPLALMKEIAEARGGVKLIDGAYMEVYDKKEPGATPFSELPGLRADIRLRMRLTEFGGASFVADSSASGKCPDGTAQGYTNTFPIGTVAGASESPVDNAKDNANQANTAGFESQVEFAPSPTTPIGAQNDYVQLPQFGTVADMQGSYRNFPALQPPRPYMTTDDFWQAVHETTKKDVVADSFSRLVPLKKFRGTVFTALSNGCYEMKYHWHLDEGFLTGRSASFHWQRLNEVPKRFLLQWSNMRKGNDYMPLRGILAMSRMTDRQLDSFEVGKTIANQWKLLEWGIPSRPHMSGPFDFVRPICRFLAGLSEQQLAKAEAGTLAVGDLPPDALRDLQYARLPPTVTLRVDYIPVGMHYWSPFFEQGKEEVHDDLIFASTKEDLIAQVQKRFPKTEVVESKYSEGLMGLRMQGLPKGVYVSDSADMGDQHFGVGHRINN